MSDNITIWTQILSSANALLLGMVCLILFALIYNNVKFVRRTTRCVIYEHLGVLMLIVWLIGVVMYSVGGYLNNDFLRGIPMALMYATQMFFSSSNLSYIRHEFLEDPVFMTVFGVSNLVATMLSMAFILRQFGYQLVEAFRLWLWSWVGRKKQNLYVFWGINETSYALAKDIVRTKSKAEREGKARTGYRILFVKTEEKLSTETERVGLGRMFNFVGMQRRELDMLNDLNAFCTVCSMSLQGLNVPDGDGVNVLKKMMGMNSLVRFMKNKTTDCVHFFFLGTEEDDNVSATINLLRDVNVQQHRTKVYCRSRRCEETHWLEYYNLCHPNHNVEVNIIDSARLAIDSLRLNPDAHPVCHMTIDPKSGTTQSAFNSIILGAGRTGIEALKFLYEFGTFVDSDYRRAPFKCTVVDRDMKMIESNFYAKNPAMRGSEEVVMTQAIFGDEQYWKVMEDVLPTLDYAVVCPGNDQKSIEIVASLCRMSLRWRSHNSAPLCIYVRSYDSENFHRLDKVCKEISDKYVAYGISVRPFGSTKELFSHRAIVDDMTQREAKLYNYIYSDEPQDMTVDECWKKGLGIKDNGSYSIDELEEIERKTSQNYCNSLHAMTKMKILSECGDAMNPTSEVIETLSRLEHERWMAYLKVNGWQRLNMTSDSVSAGMPTRITAKRLHADICSWDEIRAWDKAAQKDVQNYDRKVVMTTIAISRFKSKNV